MDWTMIVRPKPTEADFLKTILFCNFVTSGAGALYYKRYYKNRHEVNPFFLLTLCYTGLYLNCLYLLPIDWDHLEKNYHGPIIFKWNTW